MFTGLLEWEVKRFAHEKQERLQKKKNKVTSREDNSEDDKNWLKLRLLKTC